MKITYRPYNQEEIKILRSRKFSAWKHFENFGIKWVLICIGLLIPFLIYDELISEVPPHTELPIIIGLQLIALFLVIYWMGKAGEFTWNRSIEHEIQHGQAEIISIKTDQVVKRKDPEDFGTGFYFKIDEKRVLYLQGQYLDLMSPKKFPNTEFQIVRSKWNNEILDIQTKGERLKPIRKIVPFTKEQYKIGNVHYDGDVIEIPIEKIK